MLVKVRGGPLDILGGGVSDPKKKFMQGIELEKKIPASAWRKKKKFVQLHGIDWKWENMQSICAYTFIGK